MKLSIVIVNWNTCSLLRACLRSLGVGEGAPDPDREVIVVDNASVDGSAEAVQREFPGVILIANESNLGYAPATNQGLSAARGDHILLLNPDTEVPPGSLETLLETLAAHPEAAAVAPRLVGPDGRVQHSVRGFPTPRVLLAEAAGLAALFPRSRALGSYRMRYWSHDDEREVDQPMASCFLIRRSALEAVGLHDEQFRIFFSDVDWCCRARALGWTIRFTPRAEIVHHGGAGTSQVRRAMLRESGQAMERYFRKHHRGRSGVVPYALSLLAIRAGTAARVLAFDLRALLSRRPSPLADVAQAFQLAQEPAQPGKVALQVSPSADVAQAFQLAQEPAQPGKVALQVSPSADVAQAFQLAQEPAQPGRVALQAPALPERSLLSVHMTPEARDANPDLIVAIVNWNTRGDLESCLRSLYEGNDAPPSYLAVVVDNASADGSAEMVAERFPQAVVVRNRENRGFAAANNQVLKGSRSRYVFLLNPDTQTHPGALRELVRFMDDNPSIGICGPLVLNPDGSVQYSARRFPTPLAGAFRNTFLGRLFPNNRYTRDYLLSDWDHRSQRDVDWLSGAALLIRREVLDQIGVLDEQFFMYSEDVDFCYRAGEAGWRVTFFPGASLTHARAHSSDQAQIRMLIQFHRSMYRFWHKHYAKRSSWPMRILAPAGIILRAILILAKNLVDRTRGRFTR